MGLRRLFGLKRPFNSAEYWTRRYASGGNSGAGSYGRLAQYKADTINEFVRRHGISSVIEFGSGDGNQLRLADYPAYTGFDVAQPCIDSCRAMFAPDATKTFANVTEYRSETAELALSLDVIYHLIEDGTYDAYMRRLFGAAKRYVMIYSSCEESPGTAVHVRHRRFTDWIEENAPGWRLTAHLPNPYPPRSDPINETFADFYIFEKAPESSDGP